MFIIVRPAKNAPLLLALRRIADGLKLKVLSFHVKSKKFEIEEVLLIGSAGS